MPYIQHVHLGHQVKDGPRYHLTEEDVPWVEAAVNRLFELGYHGDFSFEVGPKENFYKEAGTSLRLLKKVIEQHEK